MRTLKKLATDLVGQCTPGRIGARCGTSAPDTFSSTYNIISNFRRFVLHNCFILIALCFLLQLGFELLISSAFYELSNLTNHITSLELGLTSLLG